MSKNKQAILSGTFELTVPFYDTDPMGVVWHGNYFRYFENAREHLLASIDYGYRKMRLSGYVWPVIDTRVKYIAPLHFEQKIRVHTDMTEYENRLRFDYKIIDCQTNKITTKAHTIQVAVLEETGEMCFASPTILLEKLGISQ
ncbi:acyl-CoA thioesterase [Neisseria sp. Ec49-e6-T10]|uniref:acyl-CoA thioesterase n=1 Tax=Neisseria sp. Ec49-e6-T10 TaxID=3140744 RepID=UPI003EC06475